MPSKQDYIEAINEKFDERLSKASKSKENGPAGTGPSMESGSSDVSTKGE